MFRRTSKLRLASARLRSSRTRWSGNVETLEGRSLLATFTWISPVDGSFNDATKWVDSLIITAYRSGRCGRGAER